MSTRHSVTLLTQIAYDYGEKLEELGRGIPQAHWIIAQAKAAMSKLVNSVQDRYYTLVSSGTVDFHRVAYELGKILRTEYGRIKALASQNQAIAA